MNYLCGVRDWCVCVCVFVYSLNFLLPFMFLIVWSLTICMLWISLFGDEYWFLYSILFVSESIEVCLVTGWEQGWGGVRWSVCVRVGHHISPHHVQAARPRRLRKFPQLSPLRTHLWVSVTSGVAIITDDFVDSVSKKSQFSLNWQVRSNLF
jgi:hypothetical protein